MDLVTDICGRHSSMGRMVTLGLGGLVQEQEFARKHAEKHQVEKGRISSWKVVILRGAE